MHLFLAALVNALVAVFVFLIPSSRPPA